MFASGVHVDGHAAPNGLPRSDEWQMLAAMDRTLARTALSSAWRTKRPARTVLAFVIVLVAFPAFGANREAKEKMARTACLAGDYAKGVTLLSELFVSTNDPNFIFNSGRCYEQNSRYSEAISRFKEYLRVSKRLSDEDRADVQKHIDDCQDSLEKQAPRQLTPALEQPASSHSAPTPIVSPEATPPVVATGTSAGTRQPSSKPGSGLRVAGITIAAVGGAALVAGIIFNLKANSLASDLKKTDGYTSDKESSRKTYQTLGWVGYGAGAACVATGAVLYVLGLNSSDGSSVAFVPAFAPGQAGAVVKGSF
jgi:tetratricopeptide (TPR) repeat protein